MAPRRRHAARPHRDDDADDSEFDPELDLHGLPPATALERLGQFLHAARVRGAGRAIVITGRGASSPNGQPVLRERVEEFLGGESGRRLGVRATTRVAKGGALAVELARAGESLPPPKPKPPTPPRPRRLDPRDF